MQELITAQQIAEIGKALGNQIVQLLRDRINKQQEVNGGAFPKLAPGTIRAKQRKGGGVRGNAEMRMKATNDFVTNAYEYKVERDGVTVFVSNKVHKLNKIANERKKWETNRAKGRNQKTPKPTYTNKQGAMVTYHDIAMYNMRGEFDYGWRKAGNPGANFFGFSPNDEYKIKNTFTKLAYPIIKNNIANAIRNCIR